MVERIVDRMPNVQRTGRLPHGATPGARRSGRSVLAVEAADGAKFRQTP
jgi:hypothetical protein